MSQVSMHTLVILLLLYSTLVEYITTTLEYAYSSKCPHNMYIRALTSYNTYPPLNPVRALVDKLLYTLLLLLLLYSRVVITSISMCIVGFWRVWTTRFKSSR